MLQENLNVDTSSALKILDKHLTNWIPQLSYLWKMSKHIVKKSIIFVTGNKNKLKEVEEILGKFVTVKAHKLDCTNYIFETIDSISL